VALSVGGEDGQRPQQFDRAEITVITGGSYGAGNYAMCGKAFDPRFIFAWPNAKYAVMGAAQASDVVYNILAKAAKDRPKEELDRLRQQVKENYVEQADIRYAAARGWVDAVIQPHETRATLLRTFALATRRRPRHRSTPACCRSEPWPAAQDRQRVRLLGATSPTPRRASSRSSRISISHARLSRGGVAFHHGDHARQGSCRQLCAGFHRGRPIAREILAGRRQNEDRDQCRRP